MARRQLAALFVSNLAPFTAGFALLGLLPIYATQLGANESIAGVYLSLAFVTVAAGSLISGWLSDRFQQRKSMIILAGCVGMIGTFLMGQANTLPLLTIFTMVTWFTGGMAAAMINILTGMYADAETRGRTFGVIGLTGGLGAIMGGFAGGYIVDHWGYSALFNLAALTYIVQAIAGLFLDDTLQSQAVDKSVKAARSPLGRAIWMLIAANLVASITNSSVSLGRPLMMAGLGFDASAITSVITVGGLVGLLLPLLIGWLSDRLGRSRLLMAGYLLLCLGSAILSSAIGIGQFWLASAILAIGGAAGTVGFAYITDLASPETLGTAISRFSSTPWIAGVIGYGATGFVIQGLGLQTTFLLAATLPLIGILLLFSIRPSAQPVPA